MLQYRREDFAGEVPSLFFGDLYFCKLDCLQNMMVEEIPHSCTRHGNFRLSVAYNGLLFSHLFYISFYKYRFDWVSHIKIMNSMQLSLSKLNFHIYLFSPHLQFSDVDSIYFLLKKDVT